MCTQEFRIRHINGVGITEKCDIFRSLRKNVRPHWVELEEFADVTFALLQLFVCNQLFIIPLHAARRAMAAVMGVF